MLKNIKVDDSLIDFDRMTRNKVIYDVINKFGDKLDLPKLVNRALEAKGMSYPASICINYKQVILVLLFVQDLQGNLQKDIDDGFHGWYRYDISGACSKACREHYKRVLEVIGKEFPGAKPCKQFSEALSTYAVKWHGYSSFHLLVEKIFLKQLFHLIPLHDLEEILVSVQNSDDTITKVKCVTVLDSIYDQTLQFEVAAEMHAKIESTLKSTFDCERVGLGCVGPILDVANMSMLSKSLSADSDTESAESYVATPVKQKYMMTPHSDSSESDIDSNSQSESASNNDDCKQKKKRTVIDGSTMSDGGSMKKNKASVIVVTPEQQKHKGEYNVSCGHSNEEDPIFLLATEGQIPTVNTPGAFASTMSKIVISFTPPVKQQNGSYRFGMFVDSLRSNGGQEFVWKAKPFVETFQLMRWLGGKLVLGGSDDVMCSKISNSINGCYSIRSFPGDVKDDCKKIKGAYLLQAAGVIEIDIYSSDPKAINDALDECVKAFRKIVMDKMFHKFYCLAAAKTYYDEFKQDPEEFKNHLVFLKSSGRGFDTFDFSKHRLVLGIHLDDKKFIKDFGKVEIEVKKNCALDMLLSNDNIKKFASMLFGPHYRESYASVVWKHPKGRQFSSL
jgi:hypothetical protein